ncbi:MAG: hypothetical protein ACRCR2_02240 [Fusobacteriaceae bacterium]
MGYLGMNPKLKTMNSSVYVAKDGEKVLPLKLDAEYLLVKNGVILTPTEDYFKNNVGKVELVEPAVFGDQFYLINVSTFTFNGMPTSNDMHKQNLEIQKLSNKLSALEERKEVILFEGRVENGGSGNIPNIRDYERLSVSITSIHQNNTPHILSTIIPVSLIKSNTRHLIGKYYNEVNDVVGGWIDFRSDTTFTAIALGGTVGWPNTYISHIFGYK